MFILLSWEPNTSYARAQSSPTRTDKPRAAYTPAGLHEVCHQFMLIDADYVSNSRSPSRHVIASKVELDWFDTPSLLHLHLHGIHLADASGYAKRGLRGRRTTSYKQVWQRKIGILCSNYVRDVTADIVTQRACRYDTINWRCTNICPSPVETMRSVLCFDTAPAISYIFT